MTDSLLLQTSASVTSPQAHLRTPTTNAMAIPKHIMARRIHGCLGTLGCILLLHKQVNPVLVHGKSEFIQHSHSQQSLVPVDLNLWTAGQHSLGLGDAPDALEIHAGTFHFWRLDKAQSPEPTLVQCAPQCVLFGRMTLDHILSIPSEKLTQTQSSCFYFIYFFFLAHFQC